MFEYSDISAAEAEKFGLSLEEDGFESGRAPQIFAESFESYVGFNKKAEFFATDVTAVCGKDFVYVEVIANPETDDAQLMSWKKTFEGASEQQVISEFKKVINELSHEEFIPDEELPKMGFEVWQDNKQFSVFEDLGDEDTEESEYARDSEPEEYTQQDFFMNPGKYISY